jgi:hypothetical protein
MARTNSRTARERLGLVPHGQRVAVGNLDQPPIGKQVGQAPTVPGGLHAVLGRPNHERGTVKAPQPLADLQQLVAAGAGGVLAQVASNALLGLQWPQPAVEQLVGQRAFGQPAEGDRQPTQGAQPHRLHRQEDASRDHRGQPQVPAGRPGG